MNMLTALIGTSAGVLMGQHRRLLAAEDTAVAAVWHPCHARFVVQMSITERR